MFKKRNGDGEGAETSSSATLDQTTEVPQATAEQPQPDAAAPAAAATATATQDETHTETQDEPAGKQKKEKPAKAEKAPKQKREKAPKEPKPPREKSSGSWSVERVRNLVGRVVWLICVLFAVVLALSALMFALDFKASNALVNFFYELADGVDLGVFDVDNPLRDFRTDGMRDLTKITLLNYGVGAVVYLVAGRVLERVIRP